MRKLLSPGRLVGAGVLLLGAVFLVLWLTPSSQYIFLPDRAHPVDPIVRVKGEKGDRDGGGIFFIDVIVRRATLLERLFPGVRDGATLVSGEHVNPPGTGDAERRRIDLREMARSQDIAAAVALRELGYEVLARPTGALVQVVLPRKPSTGKLKPTDVIVSVDGKAVRTPRELRAAITRRRPGETVRLGVRTAAGLRRISVETAADEREPSRPIIGVVVGQAAQIELPIPVRIDAGSVGGPSAGLAFALDVMEALGRDVDRGLKVAATGEIELDGTVAPVGGLKQKTIGARETGVDVLLVPAGENAREARRYAKDLPVVPVHNFRQALRALATIAEND